MLGKNTRSIAGLSLGLVMALAIYLIPGMTGTADTEAEEFMSIYKLEVVVVPTNRPMIREDCPDVIYRTEKEKFDAVIDEIRELNKISRPVLVGTISIENC